MAADRNGFGHQFLRGFVALAMLVSLGTVLPAPAASAATGVSVTTESISGFPTWYEDAAGTRLVPCLDGNDPCVLPAAGEQAGYDPAAPLAFPNNFPLEFFYFNAQAAIEPTPGCAASGIAAGRARLVLAVEGAFANEVVRARDRMTFGRIRVTADGLCPGTEYTFTHPYGTVVATADATGAIATTSDLGCVPAGRTRCDWSLATRSPVFGGFLRSTSPPTGYLGDGRNPSTVTGGTNGNRFAISDASGELPGGTDQFVVSGKLAALAAAPASVAFAGVASTTESGPQTVTVTNLGPDATLTAITVTGADSAQFLAVPGTTGTPCAADALLARDASCTLDVTFAPTGDPGARSATLEVASTAVRTPLVIPLSGQALAAPDAPALTFAPTALDFGEVRRLTTSAVQQVTITNTGTGASLLEVTSATTSDDQFAADLGGCTGLLFPGVSCTLDVDFTPTPGGPASTTAATLTILTNAGTAEVALTGTGVGGTAAVSTELDPDNGFPVWYRDDNGLTVGQCLDPADPYCLLLPDAFYSAAARVDYPTNFPSEFFYQVAEAVAGVRDPACSDGTADAMLISAVEAAFANEAPTDADRMTFGRIRFRVGEGGLCPNTEYEFISPFGADRFTTDEVGALKPSPGTEDVGCAPTPAVPPNPAVLCDFTQALPSRVFADLVRWDPAFEPQAPAGHLGDPAVEHRVVGGSYSRDGVPVHHFEVRRASDGLSVGSTDLFSVMGRLAGPLESDPAAVDFASVPQGASSTPSEVTLANTGDSGLTIESLAIDGPQAADFAVDAGTCTAGTGLATAGTCTASVTFTPSGTGTRGAHLTVRHTGRNTPLVIPLTGIGGTTTADIGFLPRSVDFGALHVGRPSHLEKVTVTNVGGGADLTVMGATVDGDFAVVGTPCPDPVAPGSICPITVQFTPTAGGVRQGTLTVTSNDPDGPTTVALTGFGSTAIPSAGAIDPSTGFPAWYGDSNGVRLEPCLRGGGNCLLAPGFDPAAPAAVPGNFPDEFFYAHAATEPIDVTECTPTGRVTVEVALEGAFANDSVNDGDQIVFTRTRILGSGLCAGAEYTVVTPYGPRTLTASDGTNPAGIPAGIIDETMDVDVPLDDPLGAVGGQADSFLRWNPNVAPAAPAGYVGDARTPHAVIGGTYVPPGANAPLNAVVVQRGATELGRTDQFLVSGRIGGPLLASPTTVDFGNVLTTGSPAPKQVTITNIGAAQARVSSVTVAGTHASLFTAGTGCDGAALATDASCTIDVGFTPGTTVGSKTATLVVTGANGSTVDVSLAAVVNAPTAPIVSVSPTSIDFGTVRVGSPVLARSIVVTNTGTAPLGLGAVTSTLPIEFEVVNGCTGPVMASDSCAIDVTFTPDASETLSGAVTIDHGNAAGGSTTVTVTATGAASTFTVSPDPGRFGRVRVGQTKTTAITVRNTGTISVNLGTATVGGTDASSFQVVNDAGTSNCLALDLAAGASCQITVRFSPTEPRAYAATLTVTGDASSQPRSVTIQLTGSSRR